MSMIFMASVLKASCILAAAAAANVLLYRRVSAAWRHLVWTLTIAAMLLLPFLSIALPSWQVPIRVAASHATAAEGRAVFAATTGTGRRGVPAQPGLQHAQGTASMSSGQGPAFQQTPLATRSAGGEATGTADASIVNVASLITVLPALAALYFAGVCVLFIRLGAGRWVVGRLARAATEVRDPEWMQLLRACERDMGVPGPVPLLRSLERTMPMAFGTRRPSILIPSIADTWSDDRRRAVLLHELAHIARHDCFTQLMAAVTCAIYWIHPGAWWVARRLRIERELACDDRVLAIGTRAREYAGHLLDLAYMLGGSRAPALSVSMARPRQIEGRMLAVLDAARNRATPALRGRLAGIAIASALVIPIAAAEATIVPVEMSAVRTSTTPSPQVSANDAAQERSRTIPAPGTWEIRPSDSAKTVYLRIHERANSSHGTTIALDQLEGLSAAMLSGAGGPVQFSIRRDAGVFAFEGMFRSGVGAGTYTFTPSATFPAEMVKRGFARPAAGDQYVLAMANIGFAFLDELNTQRYTKPDLAQLVRAADHGVDLDYVREMGAAGYHLGQIDALITQRDHGITPQYIREMAALGLTGLSVDDLIRARDHGVDPQYVGEMKGFGYTPLSLDALIGARDHGIDPEYVRDLRQLGYSLTLTELITARDHGVDPEYIRAMTGLGYARQSLEQLIAARDHGLDPEYMRGLRQLGYQLTMVQLTTARDHGVDPEYIRGMNALGYQSLSLDDLIRLRDHGVDPAYARAQNDQRHTHLSIEELVSLRDHGGETDGRARIDRLLANLRALVDRWLK
jgi:beta-lactamase regulating signal transducer with metallopeptidase domain